MRIERTKNATRNIFWGILEKIVSLLLPFALRTVMIKTIGIEYLGISSLFGSILSVLSVTELGFGSAIVFSMYKPIAEDDNDTICALLNVYRKIYYVVGSIILVGGLAVLPFLPQLINGEPPKDTNIYILYLIFLLNTVIGYFLFAYKAVLFSAHQRNDIISKRSTVINLISNVLQLIILIVFKNYYAYVIIIPMVTIVNSIINAYLAKKMFPQFTCRGNIDAEMKKGIKKRVTGLLSFKIHGVIFNSVDTFVISAFLGLTSLAIFNNYHYIQTSIIGFLTILMSSITAGVGNKMITDTPDENYKDFKNIVFVNAWISGWCAICMLCLYQPFISLWVGESFLLPFETMLLMVFLFLLPRITCVSFTYREAAGLWWEDRLRPLIAAVVNLTVNLILVRFIGLNGVIISTLVCTVFINVPWGTIILFKNYFKRSPIEYFLKILRYILIISVCGVITYFACELLPPQGLLYLIIKGIICLIVPNLLLYLVFYRAEEFEFLKRLIMRFVPKRMTK